MNSVSALTLKTVSNWSCFIAFIITSNLASFGALSKESSLLTLDKAIAISIANDIWFDKNKSLEHSTLARGQAESQQPDPKLSFGLLNLPSDNLSLSQQPMSQVKFSISQDFLPGDTSSLMQKKAHIASTQFVYMRENRQALIKREISKIWLDIYHATQIIRLIEKNKKLFAELVDISHANYASAAKNTQQEEIIAAQLKLVELDEQILTYQQKLNEKLALLQTWLQPFKSDNKNTSANISLPLSSTDLSPDLPVIKQSELAFNNTSLTTLAPLLSRHPKAIAQSKRLLATSKSISIAKQTLKPQWGINAGYAYRASDAMDNSRADLLSVGITMSIPLFSDKAQQLTVDACIANSNAEEVELRLTIKQLYSDLIQALTKEKLLRQRLALYTEKLLTGMHERSEAALTSYTNDSGSFSDVIQARIAELDTQIARTNIAVEQLKEITEINYLLTHSHHKSTNSNGALIQ